MSASEVSSTSSIETIRRNFNIDWRAKKPSFNEQIAHFYMKDEMADVEFVFNRRNMITKIPAHTFALSVASEVFQKELGSAENEAEKRSKIIKVIEVKDEKVEIDALKKTLLFIYNAYKNVELTGESALAVLYIGMKYMIKPLESFCVNFLVDNLSTNNIFTILQFCLDCEVDKRLMNGCIDFIRTNTEEVLGAEQFPKISHKCLSFVLKDDRLNVAEILLFHAAVSWAKSACNDEDEDPDDGKILRAKLGTALHLIRFTTLSMNEFGKFVVPSGILQWEEQRDTMLMIGGADPIGVPLCIKNTPRERHDYVAYTEIVRQPMSQTQFSLLIHIENFPSFITSKAKYESKRITVNNTEWYIHLNLKKYCQTGKEYIRVPPSSLEQPETLAAFVYGERRDGKECSFDVKATFNFKQPETVDEGIDEEVVAHKFSFCASSTKFNWGLPKLAKIDDILDEEEGYLIENSLELLVDVSITEIE